MNNLGKTILRKGNVFAKATGGMMMAAFDPEILKEIAKVAVISAVMSVGTISVLVGILAVVADSLPDE